MTDTTAPEVRVKIESFDYKARASVHVYRRPSMNVIEFLQPGGQWLALKLEEGGAVPEDALPPPTFVIPNGDPSVANAIVAALVKRGHRPEESAMEATIEGQRQMIQRIEGHRDDMRAMSDRMLTSFLALVDKKVAL